VSHLYTLLISGTVISGDGSPDHSAIAWAEGTVLMLGSDADVLGISRGDSYLVDLDGAWVVPIGAAPGVTWPTDATLEIGGPADLAIVARDPRGFNEGGGPVSTLAVVRGGRVVSGELPAPLPIRNWAGSRTSGHDARH